MNYELYFYCLLAFVIGRMSKGFTVYVGRDHQKYKDANLGILLK